MVTENTNMAFPYVYVSKCTVTTIQCAFDASATFQIQSISLYHCQCNAPINILEAFRTSQYM
jgi:hypothetical protein